MNKRKSLLFDPPHILSPDVVLIQKCEKCGKALGSPYQIIVGIPPSPLMVEALSCESVDDEKEREKSVMSAIQHGVKEFNIESQNQWVFSEQNIMSSKKRVCTQCFGEYIRPNRWNPRASSFRIRRVCFAVQEYQRLHTPIEPGMSEYEKYKISLPDRATAHWRRFGEVDVRDNEDRIIWSYFEDDMQENL